MNTRDINDIKFSNSELLKTVNLLLDNSFNVYIKEYNHAKGRPFTYAFYEEGNNLAYLQAEYSGVKYSTVHVPSKGNGTGFGLCETPLINLSIDDLRQGFVLFPEWARSNVRVEKYKGIEEYLQRPMNQMAETIKLIRS